MWGSSKVSAPSIWRKPGEDVYQTMIYLYDGWVREIFCEVGYSFDPEFGQAILKGSKLQFTALQDGLIRATTEAGSILLSPRGRSIVGR